VDERGYAADLPEAGWQKAIGLRVTRVVYDSTELQFLGSELRDGSIVFGRR